ncbi:hypothetical protein [Streptomyces sp. NPDC058486]|uniref:hypothetical protein n=1 Tax=unclassified Streptomyces TaxID=2593676 RepID=UPI003654D9E7
MSVSTDQLDQLERTLESGEVSDVLGAVWNVLDLAGQAADLAAWATGYDELRALAAAQSCTQARSLLPLPSGSPVGEPADLSPEAWERYVSLLRKAHGALTALLREVEGSDDGGQLQLAAGHLSDAAEALASVRSV